MTSIINVCNQPTSFNQDVYPSNWPPSSQQLVPLVVDQMLRATEEIVDVSGFLKHKIKALSSQIKEGEASIRNHAHQEFEKNVWIANCFLIPLIVYPIVTLIGHLALALTTYDNQARYADYCSHWFSGKLQSRINCEELLEKIDSVKKQLLVYKEAQAYVNDLQVMFPNRIQEPVLTQDLAERFKIAQARGTSLKFKLKDLSSREKDKFERYCKGEIDLTAFPTFQPRQYIKKDGGLLGNIKPQFELAKEEVSVILKQLKKLDGPNYDAFYGQLKQENFLKNVVYVCERG
ncbi:MAG: hypothetical protein H0T62_04975 [Parachlamydiaceae bacterium]|nr:hypothetical protein [Parachlamydiaceae bacterium]